jgi:hypothetical protein
MNKIINSLNISNTGTIDANGSKRGIRISGQVGAKFSLTIKDSSNRNILEDYLNNVVIPKSGTYTLTQAFPAFESNNFTRVDNTETYTITISPGAFTSFDKDVTTSYEILQYPDPTITITSDATIDTNAWGITASVSGADATLKGKAMRLAETIPNNFTTSSSSTYTKRFGEILYNITVPASSGRLYISKTPNIVTDLKKSTDVKRVLAEDKGNKKTIVLTTPPDEPSQFLNTVKEGMTYRGSYVYTKLFDSNITDSDGRGFSDKIKLNNIENLVVGMVITGENVKGLTTIISIDSDTDITISLKQKLTSFDQLTFTKKFIGKIDTIDAEGNITTDSKEVIAKNANITLTNDTTSIHGKVNATGSGSATITLSGTYQVRKFGKEDVTFTQTLGNFITAIPNAHTQYITTTKDTPVTFDLLALDTDLDKGNKTPTWEAQDYPLHGTINASSWTAGVGTTIYTPHTGYTGTDKIYFYTSYSGQISARTPIYITIT